MFSRISGWVAGALAVIVGFALLLIIRWADFPIFLDLYYHASCMMGFKEAGGLTIHDFWEYAPVGRPHLYPPLLPLLMLLFNKLGLSVLSIMRLFSVIIFPSVLLTIWWVVRRLYSQSQAFFTVAISSVPYTFFLTLVNALSASLALIILLLLFYSLEEKKVFQGALLLGLSFYTHGILPWIAILTLVLYALLNREKLKSMLIIILGGVIFGSPWVVHLIRHKAHFLLVNSYENRYLEANLLIYILAVFGVLIAARRKGKYLFPLILWVAMLPISYNYIYRFLCGEGLLPLVLLGGFALDGFYHRINRFLEEERKRPTYTFLLPGLIFYILTFAAPVLFWGGGRTPEVRLRSSTFTNLAPGYSIKEKIRSHEATIYFKTFIEELVNKIQANTSSEDIIYCNYAYVGGMLSVLSGRFMSCGMLNEVRPPPNFNPILATSLIIWIKNPEGIFDPSLKLLIDKLNLEKVGETDFGYIYRNPNPEGGRKIGKTILPTRWAFSILFIWIGLLVWSFVKK